MQDFFLQGPIIRPSHLQSDYVINYDNGNEYSSDTCYAQIKNEDWTEFDSAAHPLKLKNSQATR